MPSAPGQATEEEAAGGASAPDSPAARGSRWSDRLRSGGYRWWLLLVLVVYGVLTLGAVTTSSVGIPALRDDPEVRPPGLLVGPPRAIRSDEWVRSTPWKLGLIERGSDDFASPLAYPDVGLVATDSLGPVGTLLFFETTLTVLGGKVAAGPLFAATWWLPVALVAGLLPWWLRRLGAPLRIGLPATILVLLAPSASWWSWGPIAVMSWAVVAGCAALAAADRWRRQGADAVVWLLWIVAVVALARLGLAYTPWALPLGATLLVPTVIVMAAPRTARARVVAAAAGVVVAALVLMAAFLLENRDAAAVLAQTVYPGSRRVLGDLLSLAQLFGSPHLWILQADPTLTGTNQSEISSALLVLGVVSLLLLPAIGWRGAGVLRISVPAAAGALFAMALWSMAIWPQIAVNLFPLNLVPPARAGQVLGLSATVVFALALAAWARAPRGSRPVTAVTAAAATAVVTLMGGSTLRVLAVPALRPTDIWIVSALTAGAVGVAVMWPRRAWAMWPAVALAALVVLRVNPVQAGFADLQTGQAASLLRGQSQDAGPDTRWAADDVFVDALFMANGIPSVSGQQWLGPQESGWRVLDPTEGSREAWNRGASFITFTWADPGSPTGISAPQLDVILVSADPCSPELGELGVGRVVSGRPLPHACLSPLAEFDFGGSKRYVYQRG